MVVVVSFLTSSCSFVYDVSGNNIVSVNVGECFVQNPGSSGFEDVSQVNCDVSHDFEVFVVAFSSFTQYPSAVVLDEAAHSLCVYAFSDYVGTDWLVSDLDMVWFYPSRVSFDHGDREMFCVLENKPFGLQGSMFGSKL